MAIELKGNVRHNGKNYLVGETIEKIKKDEAQRLVDLGVAFFTHGISPSYGKDVINLDNVGEIHPVDDEDPAKLLDESYSYEDLKETAAAVGLEFKGNIGKKSLIALIVEQNKVDDFFEEE